MLTPTIIAPLAAALAAQPTPTPKPSSDPTQDAAPAPNPWATRVEWADSGPAAREHASVLVDTARNRVIVYAGSGYEPQLSPLADAWAFDLETHAWTELAIEGDAPIPGGSKRVAQPKGADHAYLSSGYGEQFACTNELHRVRVTDDALVFTRLDQSNPPPERALHAFGFDPKTNTLVTALGVSPTAVHDDLWLGSLEGDSVEWRRVESPAFPDARFGFPFALDTDTGRLVLFSGQLAPTQDQPMRMAADLWSIDLRADEPAWTSHDLPDAPEGRRNPCFAYDDDADRLAIWCGTADARTNVEGLVLIDQTDDGWTVTKTSDESRNAPPRRSSGFGFPDPRDDSIWLGFGNSAAGTFQDLCQLRLP